MNHGVTLNLFFLRAFSRAMFHVSSEVCWTNERYGCCIVSCKIWPFGSFLTKRYHKGFSDAL